MYIAVARRKERASTDRENSDCWSSSVQLGTDKAQVALDCIEYIRGESNNPSKYDILVGELTHKAKIPATSIEFTKL